MLSSSLLWKVHLSCLCVMLVTALSAQSDLFFSEYVEGSSNNKCIEIFNPTDQDIVMDGIYRVRIYFNGAAEGQTLRNLVGTIPSKGTFVLCNGLTDIPRDAAFAAGPNGDDILILEKNNLPLDIFGNIGCVEGDQWTDGIIGTKDQTLVRKSCIHKGVTIDPSDCDFPSLYTEWIAYPIDDLSHLGSHVFEEVYIV